MSDRQAALEQFDDAMDRVSMIVESMFAVRYPLMNKTVQEVLVSVRAFVKGAP